MKVRKDINIPRKNLEGLRFGTLIVLSFLEMKKQGTNKVAFYRCRCDCGNLKDIKGTHLSRGDTKTCGASLHRILPNSAAKSNTKFLGYKRHAQDRKLTWKLSFPLFDSLIRMTCFHCGRPPGLFNGIDRLDNDCGYEEDNVVPCCYDCNRAKSDKHIDYFYAWVEDVYDQKHYPS